MKTPSLRNKKRITFLSLFLMITTLSLNQRVTALTLKQAVKEMACDAQDIFRGSLVDYESETLKVKDQNIESTRYIFDVTEMLKGKPNRSGGQYEFTIVGFPGSTSSSNSAIASVKDMEKGKDYLLLMQSSSKKDRSKSANQGSSKFTVIPIKDENVAIRDLNVKAFDDENQGKSVFSYQELKSIIIKSKTE